MNDIAPANEASSSKPEVSGELVRRLFVVADPAIAPDSQMVLALKLVCGLSTERIALQLFQSEEAVRERLEQCDVASLDAPAVQNPADRLPHVLNLLYTLFDEGLHSPQPDRSIRRELCDEAIRLAQVLAEHPAGAVPETDALLSLMHLHAARFAAGVEEAGGLLALEEQDRALWDLERIEFGMRYLERGSRGERLSRYHLEAAIAAEHCLAATYAQTRWEEIARHYETLDLIEPSPLNALHRAVALAEWKGVEAGLAVFEALEPPAGPRAQYLWDATLGELYRRKGDRENARAHLQKAIAAARTHAEKAWVERKLEGLGAAQGTKVR